MQTGSRVYVSGANSHPDAFSPFSEGFIIFLLLLLSSVSLFLKLNYPFSSHNPEWTSRYRQKHMNRIQAWFKKWWIKINQAMKLSQLKKINVWPSVLLPPRTHCRTNFSEPPPPPFPFVYSLAKCEVRFEEFSNRFYQINCFCIKWSWDQTVYRFTFGRHSNNEILQLCQNKILRVLVNATIHTFEKVNNCSQLAIYQ